MKRIFGVALLVLPLAVGSSHATGWPFNVQMSGNFCIQGSNGTAPQAGPWYLYWPLEAHFVAPAPTGYPYWPPPQGIMASGFGGPTCPPGVPVPPPPAVAAPPVAYAPQAGVAPPGMAAPPAAYPSQGMPAPGGFSPPPVQTTPVPVPPAPQAVPPARPQLQLPPYLQPTSYSPTGYPGQPPSYWYDR